MGLRVGVLGAGGVLGSTYCQLLEGHPWFDLVFRGGRNHDPQEAIETCELLFSALPDAEAVRLDPLYVEAGLTVISSAACHRMRPDVPLVIPEVNGGILHEGNLLIAKPNCMVQSYLIPLAPLHRKFRIKEAVVTTLQAVSGAGRSGLAALDILDTVIPHLIEEEAKGEREPSKILGEPIRLALHCNRVPVVHGHLACVSVSFEKRPTEAQIRSTWEEEKGLSLPSSPKQLITYRDPLLPRTHRECERGMGVSVSALRPCPVHDWRFTSLAHNAVRGGAGGGILIAEYLYDTRQSTLANPPQALPFS